MMNKNKQTHAYTIFHKLIIFCINKHLSKRCKLTKRDHLLNPRGKALRTLASKPCEVDDTATSRRGPCWGRELLQMRWRRTR